MYVHNILLKYYITVSNIIINYYLYVYRVRDCGRTDGQVEMVVAVCLDDKLWGGGAGFTSTRQARDSYNFVKNEMWSRKSNYMSLYYVDFPLSFSRFYSHFSLGKRRV